MPTRVYDLTNDEVLESKRLMDEGTEFYPEFVTYIVERLKEVQA